MDDVILTPTVQSGPEIVKCLHGWRLTTAAITYRMPDHPSLLQEFIWQELDDVPRFPVLRRFLDFWERSIDGKLYRIKIAYADPLKTGAWRMVDEFRV